MRNIVAVAIIALFVFTSRIAFAQDCSESGGERAKIRGDYDLWDKKCKEKAAKPVVTGASDPKADPKNADNKKVGNKKGDGKAARAAARAAAAKAAKDKDAEAAKATEEKNKSNSWTNQSYLIAGLFGSNLAWFIYCFFFQRKKTKKVTKALKVLYAQTRHTPPNT